MARVAGWRMEDEASGTGQGSEAASEADAGRVRFRRSGLSHLRLGWRLGQGEGGVRGEIFRQRVEIFLAERFLSGRLAVELVAELPAEPDIPPRLATEDGMPDLVPWVQLDRGVGVSAIALLRAGAALGLCLVVAHTPPLPD